MKIAGNNFAVIGGAGFIGSHICEQLVEMGANKIVVIDNLERGKGENLSNIKDKYNFVLADIWLYDAVRHYLNKYQIDGVFHLAASWLDECYHNPRKGLAVNVEGMFNVLEACREVDSVERLIFSSSASVYGDQPTMHLIEETAPYLNKNFYGATKIAGEHLFRSYYFQHGLKGVCLRYMNVYGPRMDSKGEYVGLIPKVLDCLKNQKTITVAGDGNQIFDFVYVKDVVKANIKAMEDDRAEFGYFNVGTGKGTSINQIVEKLIQLYDGNLMPDIFYDKSLIKPGAVTSRIGSTNKAWVELGFHADMPLLEGLRRTVEWWKQENR